MAESDKTVRSDAFAKLVLNWANEKSFVPGEVLNYTVSPSPKGITAQSSRRNPNKADLVIITALPDPEGRLLRSAFGDKTTTWTIDVADGVPFHMAQVTFGNTTIKVAIASQSRMGMVDAALLSAKAIEEWQPVYLVMTGVCAGIRGKVNLAAR